ncbi:exodeoxyribonuclease V subunit alpha [Glaciecola petra]|uniref:RecBCD enzyme subunit RecD n=1 Tax=Glaciecola petra TaxID=3075602 RepID=A0ABU2ZN82_9ALTE|nr:exodeoxyribonuclease V subunit alpha [Aestuariibacter sp. P117]MDT0594070.1 exodeoxyribonuclease V subunit alpha [Aestuariibacter sp. P117]
MKGIPPALPYNDSIICMQTLHAIEAIDYFFAKNIIEALYDWRCNNAQNPLSQEQVCLLFHIFLAVSAYQRDGHICIHINALSEKRFWKEDSQAQSEPHSQTKHGYHFPHETVLNEALSTIQESFRNEAYIVINDAFIYTKRYWYYESQLCAFVKEKCIQTQAQMLSPTWIDQASSLLGSLFPQTAVKDNHIDMQQLATLSACLSRFSIITGGAGTGKTYTIARLVMLKSIIDGLKTAQIELLAPTGKAANRVFESFQKELIQLEMTDGLQGIARELMQIEAKTIHRLLKIDPITGQAKYDQHNQIQAKLVVVDESSMLDVSMLVKLIQALRSDVTLVLVGDANQLPSIESGSLLADLVNHPLAKFDEGKWQKLAEVMPILTKIDAFNRKKIVSSITDSLGFLNRLTLSRRNNQDIGQLANSILMMDVKAFSSALKLPSVKYMNVNKENFPVTLKYYISGIVEQYYARIYRAENVQEAFAILQDFVLLSPFKKGYFGTDNLNNMIETELVNQAHINAVSRIYHGKPIMIMKNDYKLGLFNGDVGIIWKNKESGLAAYFLRENSTFKSISIYNLMHFEATYSMTIHKTQGSEFNRVAVILPEYNKAFLSQQLLYTAVTRARTGVDILANKEVLIETLQHKSKRISGIEGRLS